MNFVRNLLCAVVAILLCGCDQPGSGANVPAPVVQPGQSRGFVNRAWYGEPAKNLDPVLTRRNFLVVLDGSGSMGEKSCSGSDYKIDAAKAAISAFGLKVQPEDNLGLCAFDSRGITERAPLGVNNRKEFGEALRDVRADSGTPLASAVELGYEVLKKQAARQLGYGEYYLVIVTDGAAGAGQDPGGMVNLIVTESPVVITTIGFCIGQGHSLNRPGLTAYHDAVNRQSLTEGLESVLAESEFSDIPAQK